MSTLASPLCLLLLRGQNLQYRVIWEHKDDKLRVKQKKGGCKRMGGWRSGAQAIKTPSLDELLKKMTLVFESVIYSVIAK